MRILTVAAVVALAAAGCDGGPTFAKVSGRLVVKGQPAGRVRVEFHPDAAGGTVGPSSYADTDDDGRFVLAYSTPRSNGQGAVPGRHKVVLMDMRLADSETGEGVPIRFGPEYGAVATTPLEATVAAGDQALTLEVPGGRGGER